VRASSKRMPNRGSHSASSRISLGQSTLERNAFVRSCWGLAVHDGSVLVKAGDVLVWEGDDPLTVSLRPAYDAQAQIAIVKIGRRDGSTLRWVP
jgi:hypothetical protein